MAILLETIKSSSLTARRYSNHNNNSNSNNTKGRRRSGDYYNNHNNNISPARNTCRSTVSEVLEAAGYNMTVFEPLNNGTIIINATGRGQARE
jgi:hypothetical protein